MQVSRISSRPSIVASSLPIVRRTALAGALGAALVLIAHGCSGGGSGKGSGPTLDARGGPCDSEIVAGATTPWLGNGGAGGYISVRTVSTGTLDFAEEDTAVVPGVGNFPETVPTASGFPFVDVRPGEHRKVGGSQQIEWLRVQRGGSLVLDGNTVFVVYGDVEIAGSVKGSTSSSRVDGPDLTIDADGIITITGTIDCSGFAAKDDDRPAYDPVFLPGGNGGELYISSIPAGGDSRQPRVFVGPKGSIVANGGKTFSQGGAGARAGKGGQILLGCVGDMVVAGRVAARGGESKYAEVGWEGDGGTIDVVASGDISLNNVRQVHAGGGSSTGAKGGDGGTVIFESSLGGIRLDPIEVIGRGGAAKKLSSATGGDGGTVTIKGETVVLDGTVLDVTGGEGNEPEGTIGDSDGAGTGGTGGDGGTAQVRARSALYLGSDPFPPLDPLSPLQPVEVLAEGGKTTVKGMPGGSGGDVKLINTGGNVDGFTFDGLATVRGGRASYGLYGEDGRICTTGAGLEATVAVIGSSNFPNDLCTQADLQGLTESVDLSCDGTPEAPSTVDTSTPAVIGVNFFRVLITEGMRVGDPPAQYLTITTKGAIDGDLDVYVGPEAAFGSSNPGDYTFGSATGADDGDNAVCVDTSGNPDAFVSVMVVERNNFIEDFAISVACSSTGCN